MIEFYNEQVKTYIERKQWDKELQVENFVDNDQTKISWTSSLKNFLKRHIEMHFFPRNVVSAMYRPFCKNCLYFDEYLNHGVFLMPRIFPEPELENVAISVCGKGGSKDFSPFIHDLLFDLNVQEACAQCFPFYTYEPVESKSKNLIEADGERVGNYIRRENISDAILQKFQEHYADRRITKEDIFYYVYGILHSRSYRERFAADLKKQLPRIPMVDDFQAFSQAGRNLAELHLNYESGKMYSLKEIVTGTLNLKVEQMKYPKMGKNTDKSRIIYNSTLTLDGIPPETYKYVVNGKSALDWIVERYAITPDKKGKSGIVNDPNDWCEECGNERYIIDLVKRVVHLSVESVKIIEGLPELTF